MGTGCTRHLERALIAFGQIDEVVIQFEKACDISNGGVLLALPALLANGLLLSVTKHFSLPRGFYSLKEIFLILAFIILCRVKTIEQLRFRSPGEWGKLLGLDRAPEAKTLRKKIVQLAESGNVSQWGHELSKEWMQAEPEMIFYVDGHVKTYHGSKTKLPKRYVARQRLCLRGITDYWVNDGQGRPFFKVSTPYTDGLLNMLKSDIIPRLTHETSGLPTQMQLQTDPHLYHFVLIFDREGYSPEFFSELWELRIACQTYHKYPKEDWPQHQFNDHPVSTNFGETICMKLSERGYWLGKKIWVREIRKLNSSGHQTSILSTDYLSDITDIAYHMFSRWSQENFFRYMMEHFKIDALIGYDMDGVDETKTVINPSYRNLEGKIKSLAGKLGRKKAEFGGLVLESDELDSKEIEAYQRKKGEMQDEISYLQKKLEELKDKRKKTSKHICLKDLPEDDQFALLAPQRKQLIDTIKMIAYRAETSLSNVLRDIMARSDDTRPLLREIFTTEVDLIPDTKNKTLTVCLHQLSVNVSNKAADYLCSFLNETETIYPGSDLKIIYKMVSS